MGTLKLHNRLIMRLFYFWRRTFVERMVDLNEQSSQFTAFNEKV
jgi:hypothetical protein